MQLKLADCFEEMERQYYYNLKRATGHIKRHSKLDALKWLKRALAWAMDHHQDYYCRKLIRQAERMRKQKAGK